jgi:hypothetical protein
MHRSKQTLLFVGLMLALILTACGGNAATPTPAAPAAPAASTALPTTSAPAPTSVPTAVPTVAPTATTVPTPTVAPTATSLPASGNACLAGTWELSDMSVYMQSVMAKSGSPVTFVGQTGRIVYVFGADGSAKVTAEDFTMKMSMAVQKLTFELNVVMSGGATSTYAATADKITFSNGELQGLKVSATMNGTELFNSTPAELAAMFGVSPDPKYNTFGYQCDATTLVYTPPIADAQPVVMKRVQ